MVQGQKQRVECIKQQVQDIALNDRDRFKEKVYGLAYDRLKQGLPNTGFLHVKRQR